jgi:hypothetical protein
MRKNQRAVGKTGQQSFIFNSFSGTLVRKETLSPFVNHLKNDQTSMPSSRQHLSLAKAWHFINPLTNTEGNCT